jgi:exonuclease VII small subunit
VDANKDESDLCAPLDLHATALDKLCAALQATNHLLAGLNQSLLLFQDALALMLRAQEEMNQMLASMDIQDDSAEDAAFDLSGAPVRTS